MRVRLDGSFSLNSNRSMLERFSHFARLPKDYHRENMQHMRKREVDIQQKLEEDKNAPKSNLSPRVTHTIED